MKRKRPGRGRSLLVQALGGLENAVANRVVGEAGDRLQLPAQEIEGRGILLARRREAYLPARRTVEIAALDQGADLAPGRLAVEPGGGGDRTDVAAGGIARRERSRDAAQILRKL